MDADPKNSSDRPSREGPPVGAIIACAIAFMFNAGWVWVIQQRLSGDKTLAIGGAYVGMAVAVVQALFLVPLLGPAEPRRVRWFAGFHLACTLLLLLVALSNPK